MGKYTSGFVVKEISEKHPRGCKVAPGRVYHVRSSAETLCELLKKQSPEKKYFVSENTVEG